MENKKKMVCVQSDEKFEESLQKLKDLNPGFSRSALVRMAVLNASSKNMEVGFYGIESNTSEGVSRRKKAMPKEGWCEMYGGEVKDGVCTINKYETMPTGHVRRGTRVIALTAFPAELEDFRRDILGHFVSVEEAEAAYLNKPLA